jgi:hypothetical protein
MPNFATRRPQDSSEANTLRILLICGGVLSFVLVAVPVGLLLYSSSGLAAGTVTCEEWRLGKMGYCVAPQKGYTAMVCKADSRNKVDDDTPCRYAPSNPPQFSTGSFRVNTMQECREIQRANSLPRCRQTPNFLQRLSTRIWMAFP